MARPERILLRGGTLVTMNPGRQVERGDLLIDGDRIARIDQRLKTQKRIDKTIDCRGRLIIPGLVQPHIHLCQTLFRGRADGLQLLDWLSKRIWPYEAAHSKESLHCSALIGGAELLRSGTTAILDMGTVHHTGAIFSAAKRLGLRATIGKAMMDQEGVPAGLKESTADSLAESLRLADHWHGAENGRLRYGFAPRFVLSCTEQLMKRTVAEARQRGLLLHTHASENRSEIEAVKKQSGQENVAYLHALGLSGPGTVLAHCVWLSAAERSLLAKSGTHVAHCPSSNLKLASGIAPIPELLRAGINVGLAADGAPCNNNLDGFTEMRLAALIHKVGSGPTAMPAETVLEMATLNGAKALGLADQIGSLEEGKKADLAVVRTDGLHAMPEADPISMLVYALRGSDVEHVFVDGIQRVREGKVLGIKQAALAKRAQKHAAEVEARAAAFLS